MSEATHPVDQVPPIARLLPLSLQHVLVMYAGAVAVPLIIGPHTEALARGHGPPINSDLFACGIATIIQSLGLGPLFGIRLPVMMGVTFAAVAPMTAIASDPNLAFRPYLVPSSQRHVHDPDRPAREFHAAAVPLWCDRQYYSDDRHLLDARRHQLGRGLAQPTSAQLRRSLQSRHGRARPCHDPAHHPLREGFLSRNIACCRIVFGCTLAWALGAMSFEKVAAAPWAPSSTRSRSAPPASTSSRSSPCARS